MIVTATEFNQRPSEIKSMSEHEPVFVTDRGRATTVVMSVADYERLQAPQSTTLYDVLAASSDDGAELETVRDQTLGDVPELED